MTNSTPNGLEFRVRDTLKGEYLKEDIFISQDGKLWCIKNNYTTHGGILDSYDFEELTELLPDGTPRYIVERCTGYEDKTKKAIYAGDKIISSENDPEEAFHSTIRWEDGAFWTDDGDLLVDLPSDIRIVGNVHDEGVTG